jgi:hypothetical protein
VPAGGVVGIGVTMGVALGLAVTLAEGSGSVCPIPTAWQPLVALKVMMHAK